MNLVAELAVLCRLGLHDVSLQPASPALDPFVAGRILFFDPALALPSVLFCWFMIKTAFDEAEQRGPSH